MTKQPFACSVRNVFRLSAVDGRDADMEESPASGKS
jgi:hypothetical protein